MKHKSSPSIAVPSLGATRLKRAYKTPVLQPLGSVKRLTLKSGSLVDGFGTFG